MQEFQAPSAFIILDGFGYSPDTKYNAISHAYTPTLDMLWDTYPHCIINAAGPAVGLPEGYIGNSQIGHRILGAGRVVPQSLTIANTAIKDDRFVSTKLSKLFNLLTKNKKTLHIMGLLSDAGVHSHINHLLALIQTAQTDDVPKIMLHLFLDGRDTPPKSALIYLEKLQTSFKKSPNICIGSVIGRFYAMDRDENWERTKRAYEALTSERLVEQNSLEPQIKAYYKQGITDEFMPPISSSCFRPITSGDGVLFFNFRPDRARQLTQAFVHPADAFPTEKIDLSFFVTLFSYGPDIATEYLCELPKVTNTLKHVLIKEGKSVFSIAETEKYAHITYFFSGGSHELGLAQTNILVPSIPVKTYISKPCMSALAITETVVISMRYHPYDFYLINYANADMVAHSGDFKATVSAIECLDEQIKLLYEVLVVELKGTLYITADHGNAEKMYDENTNQVHTAHTANPVPFMMISETVKDIDKQLPLTELNQVAPFILHQLRLPIPKEMNSNQKEIYE